jgi:hypothetical protein
MAQPICRLLREHSQPAKFGSGLHPDQLHLRSNVRLRNNPLECERMSSIEQADRTILFMMLSSASPMGMVNVSSERQPIHWERDS